MQNHIGRKILTHGLALISVSILLSSFFALAFAQEQEEIRMRDNVPQYRRTNVPRGMSYEEVKQERMRRATEQRRRHAQSRAKQSSRTSQTTSTTATTQSTTSDATVAPSLSTIDLKTTPSGNQASTSQTNATQTGDFSNSMTNSNASSSSTSTPSNAATNLLNTTPNTVTTNAVTANSAITTSGNVIRVKAGGDLQAALNSAQPGDTIELQSGASFIGSFVLPNKNTSSTAWITIRPDAAANLPAADVRVTPVYASGMPKILSDGRNAPAIYTQPGAHHYRFIGIEIGKRAPSDFVTELVSLGDWGANQKTLAQVPHHFVFDRVYIHGDPTSEVRRGISLNTAHTWVINSYISDIHQKGADTQTLCGWNGPGPFHIINNYLEAAGENVMFGGSDADIPNLTPSDIEIRRNYLFKPLSWKGVWTVKNLFELKHAQRVIVDGNVMENCWTDGQVGYAVQITVRNQDGGNPWATIRDVQFTNNIIKNSQNGINILGKDYNVPSVQSKNVVIANNLLIGITNRAFQITETDSYTIEHNTLLQQNEILYAYGVANSNFVFRNNLASIAQGYGINGDNSSQGMPAINQYFPNGDIRNNVIYGASSGNYPRNNYYPPVRGESFNSLFVNVAGGQFGLAVGSPYTGRASDGTDIGCDINQLMTAQVASMGVPPTP
jgi:hypothetical protein